MNTFQTSLTITTASLLFASSAMAASLQPAAGEQPFLEAAATSTLDRATVAAQAATQHPAAGQMSNSSEAVTSQGTLTRQQVRRATAEAGLHNTRFPAASGMSS